ncbi:MAG: hypothetical protein ACI8Z5_002152 [Lentimonas sp.]|jgi:uncharacterized protein (DUF983 family)
MNDLQFQQLPKVTHRQLLIRGLRCQCPNCGHAKLFRSMLRIQHSCPACGMCLERGDGYYLGPLCINYGTVVFTFVLPVLLLGFIEWIPIKLALALAATGALLLPLLLYSFSWSCWLTIYYLCLPDELHANRDEDCDDLSFEEERRSLDS